MFRKKTTAVEFADILIRYHAERFSRDALFQVANRCMISPEDSGSANATVEWLIFGIYLVRVSVTGACGKDVTLRSALLDAFFIRLYARLARAGFREEEFPELEDDIRERFREFDAAMSSEEPDNLGRIAARRILKKDVLTEPSEQQFAFRLYLHFVDSMSPVKKLFGDFKVTA